MDAAKEATFRTALRNIKIGDSYANIVAALGKPDHDQNLLTKDRKFVARVLTYDVKVWEQGLVNENNDRRVRFELDRNGRLDRLSSNVDGIPSLGK
jgi:hypothetical protein